MTICPFFSYPYSLSSPRTGGLVQRGQPLLCHSTSSYILEVFAVSFSFFPPPTSPTTSSRVLSPLHYLHSWCVWEAVFHVYHQASFITDRPAEVSAIDLPPTHSYYQFVLYRCFLSPDAYPVFFPPPMQLALLLLCFVSWVYPRSHSATSGVWFTS